MPSFNCADGLEPCNSIAPACGALKPKSAIATQALLTKLDRIMDFLLAQLNREPTYRTNQRRRERSGWGSTRPFAPLKPAPGISKSKSGPGRCKGGIAGIRYRRPLPHWAKTLPLSRCCERPQRGHNWLYSLNCLVRAVIQKSRKRCIPSKLGNLASAFGKISCGSARKSPTRRAGKQRAYLKHKLREILQARG